MKCRLMRLKTVNEYEKWCGVLDEFDPSFCAYNHANQNYKEYHNVYGYYIVRTNFTLFFVKQNNMTHRHRLDGPASISKIGYGPISSSDAAFVVKPEWFVNGINITHKTDWLKENNIDRDNISNDDVLLINLIWNT